MRLVARRQPAGERELQYFAATGEVAGGPHRPLNLPRPADSVDR